MVTAKERRAALIAHDQALWEKGRPFAGMDEAGRGPLAGPVVAGCVILRPGPILPGVDDSKRLSEKQREALYAPILEHALFAQVGIATVEEIEALNILEATRLAMARAAEGAPCDLFLLDAIDGIDLPGAQHSILHGDGVSYAIAAASILAKVTRDRMMAELDGAYPAYGFAQHKGYGTAAHIHALKAHGPCPAHRRLFIRNFL